MRLFYPSDYAYGVNGSTTSPLVITTGFTGTSTQSAVVQFGRVPIKRIGAYSFFPLATNAPIIVGSGSTQETVTPSTVTNGPYDQVIFAASYSNAHGNGTVVTSGTVGLQECLNDCAATGGGTVIVDGRWASLGGTTAMLAAAANPTAANVSILDLRGTVIGSYTWNGTAFTGVLLPNTGAPTALTTNGAVPVNISANYVVTKAGVLADTIAAPAAGVNGLTITITSATANAHTFTATGLYNTGSASVNLATFAAFAGATMTIQAYNQKWNVVSSVGVTFS